MRWHDRLYQSRLARRTCSPQRRDIDAILLLLPDEQPLHDHFLPFERLRLQIRRVYEAKRLSTQRRLNQRTGFGAVNRPAAMEQLETLGEQVGVPVLALKGEKDVGKIAKAALDEARAKACNVLIFDTAGRLQIDEELVQELVDLKSLVKPQEILLVLDAATGRLLKELPVPDDAYKILYSDGLLVAEARGGLAAVDPDSATSLWRLSARQPYGTVIDGGRVFCIVGTRQQDGRWLHEILCLDLRSGQEQWRAPVESEHATRKSSALRIQFAANGILCVVDRKIVRIYAARDGQEIWTRTTAKLFWITCRSLPPRMALCCWSPTTLRRPTGRIAWSTWQGVRLSTL